MVFFAKGATPGGMVQEMGHILLTKWTDGQKDGRTDGGEFNSPPSSLREAAGDNEKLPDGIGLFITVHFN